MTLATNWRKTDKAMYICGRSGSGTNNGTMAAPYATLRKALENSTNPTNTASKTAIRSGYYNEGGFLAETSVDPFYDKGINLEADGFVVIDGNNFLPFFRSTQNSTAGFHAMGIHFANIQGFSGGYVNDAVKNIFKDCTFTDCVDIDLSGETARCLYDNCIVYINDRESSVFFRHTFTDSTVRVRNTSNPNNAFLKSAFDKFTSVDTSTFKSFEFRQCAFEDDLTDGFSIDALQIRSIQLDGDAGNIGTMYSDGQLFSGTLTVTGGAITFTDCFYTNDFLFNGRDIGDCTLQTSPQSPLFNDNNIIGVYGLYVKITSDHACFDLANSGVNYSNILVNPSTGEFVLQSSGEGTVTSTDDPVHAIVLPQKTTMAEAVLLFGSFSFHNGEWVDRANYEAGVNDEVRFTLRASGYDGTNWSSWYEEEIFQPMQADVSGRGNGDINADMEALQGLYFDTYRVEFTLRDNGI